MTTDVAAIRARLYNSSNTKFPQVAYNARDTAAALEVPEHRIWALIGDRELPARHTGHRYLISGRIILDIKPDADVNDPQKVIETDRAYYLSDLAALFGVSYGIAQRLGQHRLKVGRYLGTRPLFHGPTILEFLNGADDPMRASASA